MVRFGRLSSLGVGGRSEAGDRGAETVIVVGDHVILATVDGRDAPKSLTFTLHLDGQRLRTFEDAGWRELRYGVTDFTFFCWAARRVVSLPVLAPADIEVVEADEDIVLVFRRLGGWLLVCETSLRLVLSGQEIARLEYGDVLADAVIEDEQVVLRDISGSIHRAAFTPRGLSPVV
jgi:hypothetical protein